jgi:hypothetical protein
MIAIALIVSLASVDPQAEPQPKQEPPPYTVEGVRRAAASADRPAGDAAADEQEPPRRLVRPGPRQQIDIAAWAPAPTPQLPRSDRLFTTSLAPTGPAWHQEFLGITRPSLYDPFGYMTNGERVEAVASNVAFGMAVDGVARLVKAIVRDQRRRSRERLRRDIDVEIALVEHRYKAYLASKQDGPVEDSVKKTPRID